MSNESMFDKFFGKNEQELTVASKETVVKKAKKGFRNAINHFDDLVIDLEEKINKHRMAIANGEDKFLELVEDLAALDLAKKSMEILEKEQKVFFGE